MPTLPTFNVTSTQAQRIQAALGDTGDGVAYKAWLKQQLKNAVFSYEAQQIQEQCQQNIDAKLKSVDADIDTIT